MKTLIYSDIIIRCEGFNDLIDRKNKKKLIEKFQKVQKRFIGQDVLRD